MTNQEFFDNAYRYHVLDGNPLGVGRMFCSYAIGCAIGCQIPDKELAAWLDDQGFGPAELRAKAGMDDRHALMDHGRTFEVLRPLLGVDEGLMGWMREAHDHAARLAARPEGKRTASCRSGRVMFTFTDSVKVNYELVAAHYRLAVPE